MRNNKLLQPKTLRLSLELGLLWPASKFDVLYTISSCPSRTELCISSEMKYKTMVWRLETGKRMNSIWLLLFYVMKEEKTAKQWPNARGTGSRVGKTAPGS